MIPHLTQEGHARADRHDHELLLTPLNPDMVLLQAGNLGWPEQA